jgi:hypothetical protein
MDIVAAQIGHFLTRKWLEERLANSCDRG